MTPSDRPSRTHHLLPLLAVLGALLALAALPLAACSDPAGTVVLVKVEGRQAMRVFGTLDVVVANAGSSTTRSYTLDASQRLPLTFAITPTGREGELTVDATARFADGTVAGRGKASVAIVPDDQVDTTLLLEPDDFVVNEAIADSQFLVFDEDQAGRQIGLSPDGTFVTVFENNCPLARCDMLARRFDATTTPAVNGTTLDTGDFIVNQTPLYGESPSITPTSAGYFVVWLSRLDPNNGLNDDVHATVLGPDGSHSLDADVDLVVSESTQDEAAPTAFARADGSVVVVWVQARLGTNIGEIHARLYAADGTPLVNPDGNTGDFLVSVQPDDDQAFPHGVGLDDGGYVIVWVSADPNTGIGNVVGRVYGANGAAVGGNLTISKHTGASVFSPRVAATDEGFVAGWQAFDAASAALMDRPLFLHRYSPNGASLSTDIPVAAITSYFRATPALAVRRSDGAIGAAWTDCNELGDNDALMTCGIRFRLLRPTGQPVGESFIVNTTIIGDQLAPTIVSAPADGFLLGWSDSSAQLPDNREGSVRARVIYPALEPHDGALGAECGAASDASCAEGLTCQPDANSIELCHATCSAADPSCPSGGVCLNGTYCAFQ